jgi:hypothetical protein
VFAQDAAPAAKAPALTVGGWGRLAFVPATATNTTNPDSTGTVTTATLPSWAGAAPYFGRVGVNFNGNSENIGFSLNLDSNGNTFGVGDQAKAWVNIGNIVKIELGKVQVDHFRGTVSDQGITEVNSFGPEDSVFQRLYPTEGMALEITPVDGLFIAAALDANQKDSAGNVTAAATFSAIQVQAGYTIKDIGMIRAQYIGAGNTTSSGSATWIQAAFQLTAVKGLDVDLGAKFNINGNVKAQTAVTLAATYGTGGLGLKLVAQGKFGDTGTVTGSTIGAFLDANYNITGPLTIGAQVSFNTTSATTNLGSVAVAGTGFEIYPYVKMGYGQGYGIIGFHYSTNSGTVGGGTASTSSTWSIPIGVEYWF